LRIGERLFAEHGYRDVSIKDITASAGLGMGSFYTYFPTKEAFYSDIIDGIEQKGVREVEKRVNSLRSPLFRLKALFYTREKRYMYPGAEERSQKGNTLFARVEELLGQILEEGKVRGVFRTSIFRDPKRMLIAIFSAVPLNGGASTSLELADDMMILIERGLKRWLRFRREERLDVRARRWNPPN
jgi:AcrR family transcriptional regulator